MTAYSRLITEKRLSLGGTVLTTKLPQAGILSIKGSVAGGTYNAGNKHVAIMRATLLTRGTQKYSREHIEEKLDRMGASLSFSAGTTRTAFSARVRKEHLAELLELTAACLCSPSFSEKELTLLKKSIASSLDSVEKDTSWNADTFLARLIYPSSHPNHGRSVTEMRADLKKVTRKTLQAFHADTLDCASLLVSIAGNITADEASIFVQKAFKKLPALEVFPVREPYPITPAPTVNRHLVSIEGKENIDYAVGIATGVTNTDPDFAALALGMQILGSGFGGRLMSTVREKEGLTYSVYAGRNGFSSTEDGFLFAKASFAPALFAQGRLAILREIALIAQKGVTEKEVTRWREKFAARYIVAFEGTQDFAEAVHSVRADNKPIKHLDTWPEEIRALSAKDVNRALKRFLLVDKLSETAAGPIDEKIWEGK